jgi:hypothetical protein
MGRFTVALCAVWVGCSERALPSEDDRDLARPADLAVPPSHDLTATRDSSLPHDLSVRRDQSLPQDLHQPPEPSLPPDLSEPLDLSLPADLSGAPDLESATMCGAGAPVKPPPAPATTLAFAAASVGTQLDSQAFKIGVADADGDGKNDVLVATLSSAGVAWGRGDGTLEPYAPLFSGFAREVLGGDVDGDGLSDLVVLSPYAVTVYRRVCGRSFAPPTVLHAGPGPYFGAIADVDHDGNADLVITNDVDSNGISEIDVLLGTGGGSFAAPIATAFNGQIWRVAFADFDGDSNLDAFVSCGSSNCLSHDAALFGDGHGRFSAPLWLSGPIGYVASADFNRDGRPDVAVPSESGSTAPIFLSTAARTFQPGQLTLTSSVNYEATAGDLDGDGLGDLVVTYFSSATPRNDLIAVYRGLGGGSFASPLTLTGIGFPFYSVALGDLDLDGRPDIVVSDSELRIVAVLLNRSQ